MATPPSLPAIPRWATLRNSLRFAYNPIATLNQYVADYGPTFEFYLGGMVKGILTTDPGLAQHVLQKEHRKWRKSPIQTERMGYFLGNGLLTSDGDYWLRQRRLIQPGFHRKRLAGLTGIMNQEIEDFLEHRFEPALAAGQPVDMSPLMMELAFRVVAKSLFTTSLQEEDLAFLRDTVTVVQAFITRTMYRDEDGPVSTTARETAPAGRSKGFMEQFREIAPSPSRAKDDFKKKSTDAGSGTGGSRKGDSSTTEPTSNGNGSGGGQKPSRAAPSSANRSKSKKKRK